MLTILSLGKIGSGKSENGNAMIMKKNAFMTNDLPFACTTKITSHSNTIKGIQINYIDTMGIDDNFSDNNIKKLFYFLRNWEFGINAVFIIVNIHEPRFDSEIQRILKMINRFINNPNFWNQFGILFTRCYKNHFNREIAENNYRINVIDFVMKLPNCQKINPLIPCFFVDSKKWETDKSTQLEYLKALQFVSQFSAFKTNNFKMINIHYECIEEVIEPNILVRLEKKETENKIILIYYYEDIKKTKFTGYNGDITYTEPITIKSYSMTEEICLNHNPLLPPIETYDIFNL